MMAPPSTDIRAHSVEMLRRDLIGPGSQDADLAREPLKLEALGADTSPAMLRPCKSRRRVCLLGDSERSC